MIAYLTDVEGKWDKLASFCAGNALVALDGDRLRLADGVTFVFGGDAIDRGPAARKIVETFLNAKAEYGGRVVLLAGNRDINKLRLIAELNGDPPEKAPDVPRPELLKWIFANTMGAPKAFEHRAAELQTTDGERVVQSYLDDLQPDGPLRRYLHACQLGARLGATLFLHGGLTDENFGVVPTMARVDTVSEWLANLDTFYRAQLAGDWEELIAYQRPIPGTHENQESVVYARPTDDTTNPHLPPGDAIARLRAEGIFRHVIGHTPSGDCPAILRDGDFELLCCDNSYGRIELGSQVSLDDDRVRVRAHSELDDGRFVAIEVDAVRGEPGPLGLRDRETGQLVKARIADGEWLLFKGLPERKVSQLGGSVEGRTLVVPR